MKSLRLRIVLSWLCYLVIGAAVLTGLYKYKPTLWVIVICGFASIALRYLEPAFPKRAHTKLQAWTLLPLFALTVSAKFILDEPIRQEVVFIGCWLVVAVSFIFQAYEDKRVWTSGDVVA
jgi:hypothetical protein